MSLRLLLESSERAAHACGLSSTIPDADRIAARRRNARRLIETSRGGTALDARVTFLERSFHCEFLSAS